MAAFAASAFGASACGASACGASACSAISVPPDFFGSPAECAFPSPPFRFCSSVFSALPACQID
jgi:hypothetical protein